MPSVDRRNRMGTAPWVQALGEAWEENRWKQAVSRSTVRVQANMPHGR